MELICFSVETSHSPTLHYRLGDVLKAEARGTDNAHNA